MHPKTSADVTTLIFSFKRSFVSLQTVRDIFGFFMFQIKNRQFEFYNVFRQKHLPSSAETCLPKLQIHLSFYI